MVVFTNYFKGRGVSSSFVAIKIVVKPLSLLCKLTICKDKVGDGYCKFGHFFSSLKKRRKLFSLEKEGREREGDKRERE